MKKHFVHQTSKGRELILHTSSSNFEKYILGELYEKIAEYNSHKYPEDPISAIEYLKNLVEKDIDLISNSKDKIMYSQKSVVDPVIGK